MKFHTTFGTRTFRSIHETCERRVRLCSAFTSVPPIFTSACAARPNPLFLTLFSSILTAELLSGKAPKERFLHCLSDVKPKVLASSPFLLPSNCHCQQRSMWPFQRTHQIPSALSEFDVLITLGSSQMRSVMSRKITDPELTDSSLINIKKSTDWQALSSSSGSGITCDTHFNTYARVAQAVIAVCQNPVCRSHRWDVASGGWSRGGRHHGSRRPPSTLSVALLAFPSPGGISKEEHVCGWPPGRFWIRAHRDWGAKPSGPKS